MTSELVALELAGAGASTVLGYIVGVSNAGGKDGPVSFDGVAGSGNIDASIPVKSSKQVRAERARRAVAMIVRFMSTWTCIINLNRIAFPIDLKIESKLP